MSGEADLISKLRRAAQEWIQSASKLGRYEERETKWERWERAAILLSLLDRHERTKAK